MSILVINNKLNVNVRPLIEKLAREHGRTKTFNEVAELLANGEIHFEPGDHLACVTSNGLKRANLNISDLQSPLIDYLSNSVDAGLIYDELLLQEAVKGESTEFSKIQIDEAYEFTRPGETQIVNLNNLELVFPSGPINTLDKYDRSFVSLYGHNSNSDAGGGLEITHIGGFDKERVIKIPVHLKTDKEENSGTYTLMPTILYCDIKLPPKPEKKILELTETLEEDQSAIIDIGKLGLQVLHGESTFTTKILYSSGGSHTYVLKPRIMNGLIIEPIENGKKLEVRVAYKSPETKKTLLTHLYDRNDNVIPIKLTVNIK